MATTLPALERTYTVPLRRNVIKVQRYRRAPKAIRVLKEFISKHMKSEDVRVGPALNEEVWTRGIQSPPPRVKVNCIRDAEGVVRVELFGAPRFEAPKPAAEKDAKKPAKKEGKDEKPAAVAAAPSAKPEAKPEAPKAGAPAASAAKPAKAEQKK